MKLLQVTTISEALEAFLLPFAEHFRSRGWVVDGAAAGVSSNHACVEHFNDVFDLPWSRNLLHLKVKESMQVLRTIVQDNGYDIVHVHTPIAAFITRYALRGMGVRPAVVYTAHGFHFHRGGNPVTNRLFRFLEEIAGPWTDRLVVMNREDFAAAKRYNIVPEQRLEFVPGIGLEEEALLESVRLGADRSAIRSALGVEPDTVIFLMVAELTPNKRHVDVLEAFARGGLGNAHLVFVGKGVLQHKIEEKANALGLGHNAHFLGYRRDVPSLMNAADVLLLVSKREGLPRSILEAMALEVPVIGSAIRGVSDLLDDGAGLLVSVGDVAGISRAMRQLSASSEKRRELASRGKLRAKDYSLASVLAEYERIYLDVLFEIPKSTGRG